MSRLLKGTWMQFFKDAGIPMTAAKRYTIVFDDNRITKDLLPDLSKEILLDMGIKVMGDILCILKHAKKEMMKTELCGGDGVMLPLAHSTTPGQQDPVSTTREARGQGLSSPEIMQSGGLQLGIAEAISILPTMRSDQTLLDATALRQPNYEDTIITESYSTAAYAEKNKHQKRQPTIYADEEAEYSPVKHPRVVVLPGERGQEMYTATALQRAAAIAVASAAIMTQEETAATQRNKKILEAAGLVPSSEKSTGGSVFSRLDGDGSSSSAHVSSPPTSSHPKQFPPSTRVSASSQVTVTMNSSKTRTAVDSSKPRTIKLGKERKEAISTSDIKTTSRARKSAMVNRLGEVSSVRNTERERTSLRSVSSSEGPTMRFRVGKQKKSHTSVSSSSGEVLRKSSSRKKEEGGRPMSMVADEMDYQTQRQSDVRSRLELKEKEKAARRRGPLAGRLEKHHVFGRLE
ncbi:uncharacterized protein C19orf47 homolog isoform X3 [Halichondria panicea]|uniref:uncharacterized protein C19orf47 homolog isoform X3 n=1 Tax=Halichondria panicea TaxID=6063 RepID=UPI00312B8FDE